MAKINEIDITSLTFQEGSAPSTPASTKWKLYAKTDGLYFIDDAGVETGPFGTGGGGGGGATVPEWVTYLAERVAGETSHALDDFFDDDTLAGTAVVGGATVTWVEKHGRMSGFSTAGGGGFPSEPGARAFPLTGISAAPVTFETRVNTMQQGNSNSGPGVYVGFSDGATAGSNIAAVYIYRDSGNGRLNFYDIEGQFNSVSAPTIWTNSLTPIGHICVRAVWSAANTFEYSFSHDGIQWTDLGQAADSVTLTPTHFFVAIADIPTQSVPASFDYLRINESDLSP